MAHRSVAHADGTAFDPARSGVFAVFRLFIVVYYESLKRELKTKKIYGYRCDERLIKLT